MNLKSNMQYYRGPQRDPVFLDRTPVPSAGKPTPLWVMLPGAVTGGFVVVYAAIEMLGRIG